MIKKVLLLLCIVQTLYPMHREFQVTKGKYSNNRSAPLVKKPKLKPAKKPEKNAANNNQNIIELVAAVHVIRLHLNNQ